MELMGITGGIGMGKTAAGQILAQWGVKIVDTDQIAREMVAPGTPGLAEVVRCFGSDLLDPVGQLRRGALGQRVFGDPAALAQLNAILHPRICAAWQRQLGDWRAEGVPVAAVTLPLLYENGYESEFSVVVCVACSVVTQQERLRQRGWDDAEIERRNRAQLPVEEKMKRSARVVWSEGSLEVHTRQWQAILGRDQR